ncbi:hypothetical protein [Nonomuraea sp. SYSU D8015]|uniref:hypothetical protein n=1 Tax=Nonomuraea sp. SYSU D8015 TaxID=2593644 RepID=UPI0016614E89|nr:hypothetical protein [Nonomuraea sp. SYSU D8015]
MDVGPPGSADDTYAHKPAIITRGGRVHHFYTAVRRCEPYRVGGHTLTERRGISMAHG